MVRCTFARLLRLLTRFRLVPRPSGTAKPYRLLPFLVVLPVALYAYAIQSIVVSRTESRERQVTMDAIQSVANRLTKAQARDASTCTDYAYWDDIYTQVLQPEREWVRENLDGGVGYSFGFDICALQDTSGDVVWQTGMDSRKLRDVGNYALLDRCLKTEVESGLMVLGGRIYSCCAAPIRRAGGVGKPHGMLLVGRLVDGDVLCDLASSPREGIALRGVDGYTSSAQNLRSRGTLRRVLSETLGGRATIPRTEVGASSNGQLSYGMLPLTDLRGRNIGTIVTAASRANMTRNMQAMRRMSLFIMLLCAIAALAGASYLKNRALALRASRDELTGLYNHGYFQERLKNIVDLARRYGRSVSLLMIDIDHFKFINDNHGHASGDKVLRELAEVLMTTFRATDVVARYGGEEFIVALPETQLSDAMLVAERLRQSVQAVSVKARGVHESQNAVAAITFTVSVGVASHPEDAGGPADLIMAADAALAEAKRTRNTAFAYSDILSDGARDTRRLETLDSFFRDSSIATIRPLVEAIDTRKPGSANHSDKTAEYAVAMGRELGLTTQELALLCKSALLHDIGEIGVPDQLLTKTGRLTPDELETVKSHCAMGAQILSQSPSLASAAEMVLHHHERYDGDGYPSGLRGDQIPLISRVIAVADSLDAMTSPRSYQKTRSLRQAADELLAQAGKQYDPAVVEAARSVIRRVEEREEHKAA